MLPDARGPIVGGQDAYGRKGLPLCHGRERTCFREGSVNVSGLIALGKRRKIDECFRSGKFNIVWIQETLTKGCGMIDCMMGSKSEV